MRGKIAIHRNDKYSPHSTSWVQPWIDYCKKKELDYSIVDCYQNNIIEELRKYDCLLWNISNYVLQDMLFARTILNAAKKMGLKVFPDFNTSWHFDDKIAEYYLLKTVDAPIPDSWVFYTKEESMQWLKNEAQYPLVAKLRTGSGSNNVKLLKNRLQAVSYTNRMFRQGYRNIPGVFFKVKSSIRTAKNLEVLVKRFKRIPDFILTVGRAKMLARERGYVYFQEYVPNDGYDLKIVVIGDKLSYVARNVRKNDFRASGGGTYFYDNALVTLDIANNAFSLNDKLEFQSMGYDIVVDKRTNKFKVVEICYGLPHNFILQSGGYWDREGTWHNEPLNMPEEVLQNLIDK